MSPKPPNPVSAKPAGPGGFNIATRLSDVAAQRPDAPAIHVPVGNRWETMTYRELDEDSNHIAAGLDAIGIGRGVRTALMVKPSREFFALTFGIFKAGAVPVVVDPGIGLRSLKQCLGESAPDAFIGIPPAHAARIVLGWARDTIKTNVTVGSKWFWGGLNLDQVRERGRARTDWTAADATEDELAAILFTSGSTGVPKGVMYRHGNFMAQVEMIRDAYDIQPGEVDLPTFPLFALFDPALGMTTVVPDMDPRKPASVDPTKIIGAIERFNVTNMFGSPALLNTVGRYGAANGVKLPTLKRVISAGAPVPSSVMSTFLEMLGSDARINTPYGATESLPVATIDSAEVLSQTAALTDQGRGVCVGRPVERATVRIIRITDEPIAQWSETQPMQTGEIGEICVSGPMVTEGYFKRPTHDALSKIQDASNPRGFWHRMGDLGYFDDEGRLWFCGRKTHRVQTAEGTLYSVPCEGVFNAHPDVFRSALVGIGPAGAQRPAICVELEKSVAQKLTPELRDALQKIAQRHEHTRGITEFYVHPAFPVDIRHNAKINRAQLAAWVAKS